MAVHTEYSRYRLVGTCIKNPIICKFIRIVVAKSVNKDFGSGILKKTPYHHSLDYEIAKRHGMLKGESRVIDDEGTL